MKLAEIRLVDLNELLARQLANVEKKINKPHEFFVGKYKPEELQVLGQRD